MSDTVDVAVLGGGPAGAALAARLAGLGHAVVVVERRRFPRPHVGESLSPAAWPLLDALGLGDRVARAGFVATEHARVRWRDAGEERPRVPGGLTVDRGAFDVLLLDRARTAGARVLEPAHAARPRRIERGWEVAAGARVLRARFVADATGRRRLLGGHFEPTAPRTLALHAVWRPGPAPDGAQTWIDAQADGWLWGAHLPGGAFRAMAFVDPSALRAAGGDREALLRRLLAASPLFADLAGQAAGPVRACDATCSAVAEPIDAASIRVGEAAFAVDPLSSAGVQTAIGTALAAAAAVHTLLSDGDADAALEYYSAHQRHAVQRHTASAMAIYTEHRAHASAPFWRARSAAAPATASAGPEAAAAPPRLAATAAPADAPSVAPDGPAGTSAPLRPTGDPRALLARPVRLAAGAALASAPCVVGDRVERRRALTHPDLGRPVAFLGGAELAPLLDVLAAAPSLAHAMRRWDAVLPAGRAEAIAAWLHDRRLLTPA